MTTVMTVIAMTTEDTPPPDDDSVAGGADDEVVDSGAEEESEPHDSESESSLRWLLSLPVSPQSLQEAIFAIFLYIFGGMAVILGWLYTKQRNLRSRLRGGIDSVKSVTSSSDSTSDGPSRDSQRDTYADSTDDDDTSEEDENDGPTLGTRVAQRIAAMRQKVTEWNLAIQYGIVVVIEWVSEPFSSDNKNDEDEKYGFHQSKIALQLDRLAYGMFGHLFRGNDDTYSEFNRKLNQARIPVSYDIYLSRVMFYSLTMSILGISIGLAMAVLLADYLVALDASIQFPRQIALFIETHKRTLAILAITLVFGTASFISTMGALYYYPYYVAGERKREIDAMLPHAITFMYAMSRGGVNVLEVLRALANAEDSYGEVSNEVRAIINNVDYVQEDLRTAVLNEAHETCSDGMQDFLEDLLNVVDTGADMEQFFLNKADVYLERARNEQKQVLDTLEIMSESYVTVFVASPIFILIILVVMSMMGGADMMMLYAMTYFGLPMGGIMFSLIIKIISQTGTEGHAILSRDTHAKPWTNLEVNEDELDDDPRYSQYKRIKAKQNLTGRLFAPLRIMRETPLYSLVVTIPLAGAFIGWAVMSGLVEASFDAFLDSPVWQTLIMFYIPFLMSFGTFSFLHETKIRRENKILARLPEAFKSASDANERGLTVEESFEIVANNSEGALAKELQQAVNETTWTGNLNDALVQFANELAVPRLSRTIKLITKANEVSGDVQAVLNVAARDVENMYKLDQERKQNAFTYIVIIIVSFFVSMGVIVMLDANFLSKVAENPAFGGGGGGAPGMGGGGGGGIPIAEFRMAFLHTVMVLGGASGLVAGTMAKNDPFSGLKYSIALMGIALLVFGFV